MKKLALLLVLSLVPACASTSAGDYFVNRGADLVDILRVHVVAGPAFAVKADAFRIIHAGIGWEHNAYAWGLANREVTGWRESVFTWGLLLGHHQEQIVGTTENRVSGSYGFNFKEKGSAFEMADPNNVLDILTVRGSLMFGVGLDLEVRVGEFVDYLAGIFQFDPSGDDVAVSKMRTSS
jgi:hypothetical protein